MDDKQIENIRKRRDKAQEMIKALCKPRGSLGSRDWTMTIPVNKNRDPDAVIGISLRDIHHLLTEVDRLRTDAKGAEKTLEKALEHSRLFPEASPIKGETLKALASELYSILECAETDAVYWKEKYKGNWPTSGDHPEVKAIRRKALSDACQYFRDVAAGDSSMALAAEAFKAHIMALMPEEGKA